MNGNEHPVTMHPDVPIFLRFLAVLAAALKLAAVGAPLVPGFRIFSPDPALILRFLAAMFAYNPFFFPGIYFLRDLVPAHFQRLRESRRGELGFLAAFGLRFICPALLAQ